MTEPLDPAIPHRKSGGRVFVLVLAVAAILATLVYLVGAPARREFARLRDRDLPVVTAAPVAKAFPGQPPLVADPTVPLQQMQSRLDALEQRVAALEAAPKLVPATRASALPLSGTDPLVTALGARMDALSGQQDRMDAQLTVLTASVKSDEARLLTAANQASAVAALSERTARLARVQAAAYALSEGLPLGVMPNAPAALVPFETTPPPTEASLRLAFPGVAARARGMARADTRGLGFWPAVWARAGSLITVRRGDRVLVGSQQIGTIDRARVALEAGDLAGAVAISGTLTDGPATAFADWRAQAQGLLSARAALAQLARQD